MQESAIMTRQTVLLWVVAFFLTAGSAVYQRLTGPTYPIRGTAIIAGKEVAYRLQRSEEQRNSEVRFATGDSTIRGWIEWKRYNTGDPWTKSELMYKDRFLVGDLPMQPPAGKLFYRISLQAGDQLEVIPPTEPVVIRFKGNVPGYVLWPHVLIMFLAMLFSTRAGLECFRKTPNLKVLTLLALSFFFAGGAILGPVVQKYAFDAYWTGWPFGADLTDNKTALALLGWIIAAIAVVREKRARGWVLAASVILLLVYLIPHSLLGSELDYKAVDAKSARKTPAALPK
jgi:hypothetical protein